MATEPKQTEVESDPKLPGKGGWAKADEQEATEAEEEEPSFDDEAPPTPRKP